MTDQSGKKLMRPMAGRLLAGVAAGLADYFGIDVTVVRVIFAIAACLGGFGVIVYLAAWLVIPEEGETESIAEKLVRKTGS